MTKEGPRVSGRSGVGDTPKDSMRVCQSPQLSLAEGGRDAFERPHHVAVRHQEHVPPSPQIRRHIRLPAREQPLQGVFQALCARQVHSAVDVGDACVLVIVARPARVALFQWGGGVLVSSSPLFDEFFPVLLHRELLVQAREDPIVALVEAPLAECGDPQQAQVLQNRVESLYSALQHRRVRRVEHEPLLPQQARSFMRVVDPLRRQRHVHPSREPVLLVPQT
eukprot:CAMPEP_0206282610 /NCGR_PEP_ID=MMETSP0047_2-20121206/39778_1 /ASSEMBLY_ACC=CAM_ASM_000192 /TAXON_ID=195065 /ORGANISM="Chroomonas mesostigmatica_cf, Strain CCMP1168" /LENGTH=222 /DNA_ID=CAMNT_0053712899 /DNA_START=526 /DNA_END=1195 /DNA_ORIENTATION=-